MRRDGFTLVELMVVILFLVIAAALLAPAIARSSRQAKVEACAANLAALHKASEAHYGKSAAPPELGKAYWERLQKVQPPLVEARTLACPLADQEGAPAIQYFGPAIDPRSMTVDDPIGCDLEGNHSDHGREGGNVLLRSGRVVNDNHHRDGLWGSAVRQGKCRP